MGSSAKTGFPKYYIFFVIVYVAEWTLSYKFSKGIGQDTITVYRNIYATSKIK